MQVRAGAAVDPADNMGRWLATRGPAAAGSRGSPPPEGVRVAQGTGNTPGRQARDTGSTGTDSRAASAGRGRARGLRNASHTATRERAGTVALGQGPRTSEPLACGCTLPSAPPEAGGTLRCDDQKRLQRVPMSPGRQHWPGYEPLLCTNHKAREKAKPPPCFPDFRSLLRTLRLGGTPRTNVGPTLGLLIIGRGHQT